MHNPTDSQTTKKHHSGLPPATPPTNRKQGLSQLQQLTPRQYSSPAQLLLSPYKQAPASSNLKLKKATTSSPKSTTGGISKSKIAFVLGSGFFIGFVVLQIKVRAMVGLRHANSQEVTDWLARLVETETTPTNAIDSTTSTTIPPPDDVKILWMYWEQGLEHLASLAEDPESKYTADYNCVQAWLKLNPNWDIRVLDKAEAMKLAPKYAILANDTTGRINKVKASNVLRLELLTLYGGVWSDTSNCPFRPLDNFVPPMLQATKFFTPYLGGWSGVGGLSSDDLEQFRDCHTWAKNSSIARSNDNWFLAASQPHHVIMEKWLNALYERMVEIMTAPTKVDFPYYVAQCTFTRTRMMDPEVEAAWKEFQKSPHFWESFEVGDSGMCFVAEAVALPAS